VSDVYREYKTWCEIKEYKVISDRMFNKIMQKEIKKEKHGGNMYFFGISIKTSETSSETESEEAQNTTEPIIQKKQTKLKEYIKFKDCCLHIPTFTCIKETPELNYILTNTTDLETIKTKLLKTKYFKTAKECYDFAVLKYFVFNNFVFIVSKSVVFVKI
jgi:predicted nucleic acid binding AN1-type Zn finger protein